MAEFCVCRTWNTLAGAQLITKGEPISSTDGQETGNDSKVHLIQPLEFFHMFDF